MKLVRFFILLLTAAYVNSKTINRYDKVITVFSPAGTLEQVNYADMASRLGDLVTFALAGNDQVIIVTESPAENVLLDRRSQFKIVKIEKSLVMAFSGLAGDARVLASRAKMYCSEHKKLYGYLPTVTTLANFVSDEQYKSTLTGGERPFGVNSAIFGFDKDNSQAQTRPQILVLNAAGTFNNWKASAIGRSSDRASVELEKVFSVDESPEAVIRKLSDIIKKARSTEENDSCQNLGPYLDIYVLRSHPQLS